MNLIRLADYLDHMRHAALEARGFVSGMTRADFEVDRRTQQAVIMSLVVIGEAAARIMDRHPSFAEKHSVIAWQSIRGMRNRLTHVYFEVDLDIVWNTVHNELPNLLQSLSEV